MNEPKPGMSKLLRESLALLAAMLASVGAAQAATVCVDPDSPAVCAATIQAGVDAATAGDTVVVSKGTYNENVQVPAGKDGLTIQAKGKERRYFVLDAGLPLDGAALSIASAGVTVEGLTVRNGSSAGIVFEEGADGGAVSDVHVEAFSKGCVVATGDGYSVKKSEFAYCGCHRNYTRWEYECSGVYLGGDNGSVTDSSLSHQLHTGIQIHGVGGTISGNSISLVEGLAISFSSVDGDGTANDNKISVARTGIYTPGRRLTALRNRGENLTYGLVWLDGMANPCTGATLVADNHLDEAPHKYGITVDCDEGVAAGASVTVERNVVKNTVGSGIVVYADGAVVRDNKVFDAGTRVWANVPHFGLDLMGEGVIATGNFASGCFGGGISINGDNSELRQNRTSNNGGCGIMVSGGQGVVLEGNRSERNQLFGFVVGRDATGATLAGNRAAKNRQSLCDSGTDTVLLSGNKLPTRIEAPEGATCD